MRRGIARNLFSYLLTDRLSEDPSLEELTLNSSPYGLPFYLAIGFVPVDKQLQMNGIIYTPMKYVITK